MGRSPQLGLGLPGSCWFAVCPEYTIQPFLLGWLATGLGSLQEMLPGQGF